MRQFINKILLFLFPVLLFALLMEIALRRIPNDYSYKKEYLDAHAHEIETLVLGNSHSFNGINPEYFSPETIFNASMVSQTLIYDYAILNKYKDEVSNLRTVIIPISYFSLYSSGLRSGTEAWRTKNYVIYYGLYSYFRKPADFSEILSNKPDINMKWVYSYYIKGNSNVTCSKYGWGKKDIIKSKDLSETGKIAALRHTRDNIYSEKYIKLFNENLATIDSIIELCQRKNVNVLLFTPPAYETYRQNLNVEQLNKTIKTAEEIAARYDNCRYTNLLEDNNFTASDFGDADHLNYVGAKKLSLLINDLIIK